MRTLAALLLLLPSFVQASKPSDIDIAIAIAKAEAEALAKKSTKQGIQPKQKVPYQDAYPILRKQAIDENKPFVVWVGQEERKVRNCVTCYVPELQGANVPSVVIGKPENGQLWRVADLPGNPSIQEILDTIYVSDTRVKQQPIYQQPIYQQPIYQQYVQPTRFFRGSSSSGC